MIEHKETLEVSADDLRELNSRITFQREPGEFTTGEFAEAQDPPLNSFLALDRLNSAEKKGLVAKRQGWQFGPIFWRKIEK